MTEQIGSGLRQAQLAKTLQQLRLAAGLGIDQVASVLGCSRSRVSHLESGRNVPHKTDVLVLAPLYGVPERTEELVALWEAANAKGWWDAYRLPRWMQTLVGLENDSVRIRCWALELVPGLAQTEDYARDLLVRQQNPPEGVERGVKLRMERQKNLERGQVFTMVFSEALVHRTAHMNAIGRAQLNHLVKMADRYNVQIRVVPFSAGAHWSMAGSFTLMEFPPDVQLGTVAYRQGADQSDLTDDAVDVAKLEVAFAANLDAALGQDATVDLIKGVLQARGPVGSVGR